MSTIINGSSPSVTFSDGTTQSTAGLTPVNPQITTGSLLNANGRPMVNQTGGILQVIQTVSNTQVGYTGTSFQTVSSLSTSITPSSTSSKILVLLNMTWGLQDNNYSYLKLQRNGSDISGAKGNPTGSQTAASIELMLSTNGSGQVYSEVQHGYNSTFIYLDSPASSTSTTYSIVVSAQQGSSQTLYLNRGYYNSGDANNIAGISSMTLMEIAG